MSAGKLYTRPGNPRGRIAAVLAQYEGVQLEEVHTDPFTKAYPENYVEKFPVGKIPAFENDQVKLFEVMAVCKYISSINDNKSGLYGKTKEEAALVEQWFSFANSELLAALGSWFGPLRGIAPYLKPSVQAAEQKALSYTKILDDYLKSRTFLVGERITVADVAITSVIVRGAEFVLDEEWRKNHTNLLRFVKTVMNQPEFLAVVPEAPFVAKAIQYTPPKKEAAPKKEKAPAPPAEKKEKAKKKDQDDDEDDKPAEQPKAKHPCEALGPAKSFPLDEWKRTYSNQETKDALKWLEEHYNPEEYTFWKAVYKYPDELTQVFMSSNLIGGFHNRLEGSRKYLFGSCGVYGTSNNSKIQGVYMLRGKDYQPVFEVAPDYESYEFSPLDFSKDKDFILGCWEWTNTFDDLPYADGKVFK